MTSVHHSRHIIIAVTLPLANRLQSKHVDIASAHSHATKVIEPLKALRSAAEDGVRKVFFSDAQALTTKMDIEITRLRTVDRQTHRDDVTTVFHDVH